ncbi:extracellular serine-rich protein [Pyronema domesticum]|nr:extracellular serine-rich protein [Pyronema domesticum]
MLLTSAILLAASSMAAAQSASATASAPATAASGATTIIKVGNAAGNLVFEPAEIKAEPGSLLEFRFWPSNHSVAQSTFDSPCTPMGDATKELFSGFHPTTNGATDVPTWTLRVNNTNPIWLYCSQGKHCQNGMTAVINPPANGQRTLKMYQAAAKSASDNVSPTQVHGGMVGTAKAGTAAPSTGSGGSSGSGSLPSGTAGAPTASGSGAPNAANGLEARWGVAGITAMVLGALMA